MSDFDRLNAIIRNRIMERYLEQLRARPFSHDYVAAASPVDGNSYLNPSAAFAAVCSYCGDWSKP